MSTESDTFKLPRDLIEKLADRSEALGEEPRDIVTAAVDTFMQLTEDRQKVVMQAVRRRRG
ncbi:hypothetical protein ACFL2Q_06655 [Thermodesulfobacteriota bacterium]